MTPNRRTGAQCDGESKGEHLRNSRCLRYLLGCVLRARLARLLRLSLLRLRGCACSRQAVAKSCHTFRATRYSDGGLGMGHSMSDTLSTQVLHN